MPPSVLSFLQQAADAVGAGEDAMETLVQAELRNIQSLAGLLRDDPEWVRDIAIVAQQLGARAAEAVPHGEDI